MHRLVGLGLSMVSLLALGSLSGCFLEGLGNAGDEFEDDPLPPPRWQPITFETNLEPALVMVRLAERGWLPVDKLSATRFQSTPSEPYTVMVVCLPASGGAITVLRSELPRAIPTTLSIPCVEEGKPFVVSGTMAQPGSVSLDGERASSSVPNWSFALPSRAGRHDLIAISTGRVLVQRDLQVTGDLALPPLDPAQQGVALQETPFELVTLPDELPSAVTYLRTERSPAVEVHRGIPLQWMPPSQNFPADQTVLRLVGERQTASRTTRRILEMAYGAMASTRVLLLWEPFVELQQRYEPLGYLVSWYPRGVDLPGPMQLEVADDQGRRITHLATGEYLEKARQRHLTTVTDAPGYLPAWRIDPSRPYSRSLETTRRSDSRFLIERYRIDERVAASAIVDQP